MHFSNPIHVYTPLQCLAGSAFLTQLQSATGQCRNRGRSTYMSNDILYLLSHGRGGLWRTSHILDPVTWTHCIGLWEREEREGEIVGGRGDW